MEKSKQNFIKFTKEVLKKLNLKNNELTSDKIINFLKFKNKIINNEDVFLYELTENNNPEVYKNIQNVAKKMGFKKVKIMIYKDDVPNAFVKLFEFGKTVYISSSALKLLNINEVSAVSAHELTHIKQRFRILLYNIVFSTIMSFIGVGYVFFVMDNMKRKDIFKKWVPYTIIYFFIMIILNSLKQAISRHYEYSADKNASKVTNKKDVESALKKLYKEIEKQENSSKIQRFMTKLSHIITTITGGATHPNLDQRIDNINKESYYMKKRIAYKIFQEI